ncbi:DUF4252 domain-containing protein [Chryseobacterium sp. SNU WT5]|uniref:DUF4252 domain-containing protein n=1 Tax=Chryseobacterium sp. SNU WT5 TaxID=2594269 RepID=UPI001627AB0B|nr:DUF4252 domain-containing protein [Chryseobacterium sp. SNU WT5]
MQKLLLILALIFSHFYQVNAQKDKLDQLFEKYQEADGVTSIKIAKPMFSMLNKLNIADDELSQIKPLLNKINGLKILIVEKPSSSAQTSQFQKLQGDINTSLKSMKYEELITVHSKDNKIKFLASDTVNGVLDNLLLNINADGNTVLMMLDGKITMDDVNNLINEAEKSTTRSSVTTENITSTGTIQVRNVGKFSGVSVSSGIKVNFTQGPNQSVIVETNPNLQEYVSTEVQNGVLVIGVKNNNNKKLNFKKLLVTIEAPQLSTVRVTSGSLFSTLNTINENDFKADISSGGDLNAQLNITDEAGFNVSSGSSMRVDIQTNQLRFQGSSGSTSTLTGNAEKANLNVSSAASVNAKNLVNKVADAQASSGASIRVNATKILNAQASSGSSIRYQTNATMTKTNSKTSSGGSIEPIN